MTKTNIIAESLMAIIDNEASTDQGPTLKATEAPTIETQNSFHKLKARIN